MNRNRGLGFPRQKPTVVAMKMGLAVGVIVWFFLGAVGALLLNGMTPRPSIAEWANQLAIYSFYAGLVALVVAAKLALAVWFFRWPLCAAPCKKQKRNS